MASTLRPRREALLTDRNCLLCKHILIGDDSMQCSVYGERILLPSVAAEDCPAFEEADG